MIPSPVHIGVLRLALFTLVFSGSASTSFSQTFMEDLQSFHERYRENPGLELELSYRLMDAERGEVDRMEGHYRSYGDDRLHYRVDDQITYQQEDLMLVRRGGAKLLVISPPRLEFGESLINVPMDSLKGMADRVKVMDEDGKGRRVYEADLEEMPGRFHRMTLHYEPSERFFTRVVLHLREPDQRHHPETDPEHIEEYVEPRLVMEVQELSFGQEDPVPSGVAGKYLKYENGEWELREEYTDHRLIDRTKNPSNRP